MLGEATLEVSGTFAGEAIRVLILFVAQHPSLRGLSLLMPSNHVRFWIEIDKEASADRREARGDRSPIEASQRAITATRTPHQRAITFILRDVTRNRRYAL